MSGYTAPCPIRGDDDIAHFHSGVASLDEYVRARASTHHTEGASRCYVTCRAGRVVGFYALAASSVERASAPGRVRRNMPEPIPVILLSRLAVDRAEQGRGLARHLLRDALIRSARAADLIGVRAVLVHATDDRARAYYAKFGFEPSPTDPLHLMLPIKDIPGNVVS